MSETLGIITMIYVFGVSVTASVIWCVTGESNLIVLVGRALTWPFIIGQAISGKILHDITDISSRKRLAKPSDPETKNLRSPRDTGLYEP